MCQSPRPRMGVDTAVNTRKNNLGETVAPIHQLLERKQCLPGVKPHTTCYANVTDTATTYPVRSWAAYRQTSPPIREATEQQLQRTLKEVILSAVKSISTYAWIPTAYQNTLYKVTEDVACYLLYRKATDFEIVVQPTSHLEHSCYDATIGLRSVMFPHVKHEHCRYQHTMYNKFSQ
jgi:hypothetical protein